MVTTGHKSWGALVEFQKDRRNTTRGEERKEKGKNKERR
jgi:hypothetical protein